MRKNYQFATFDIWDTCLTRAFSDPTHIFFEVARRIIGADRFEDPETAEMVRMRIVAEQEARKKAPGRECRFDEIKIELEKLVGKEVCARFITLELAVEREFVRPVTTVREELMTARRVGATIAFVSDMYLPSDFLSELLQANGFFQSNDCVFVSSEHRANKWTGDLFHLVRKKLVAVPASWSHIGDKRDADVLVPRRMGIRSNHFTGTGLTSSEIRFGECNAAHARNASRIVGGMRAARLSGDQPTVLTDVVAPWLCALAARMVHRAQKMGVGRLYFLSRDGEILLRIAKRIAPAGLECRYLYSSRRAWCFPAMVADDIASRRWLETFAISPRTILVSMEFSLEEQETILAELNIAPDETERRAPPSERQFVWDHLRTTDRIPAVLERASIAREACLAYLDQEGLFEHDRWAVCDVGWSLNSQAALSRLLRVWQPTAVARGFYLMVNRLRPPLEETGPFDAWLLDEALDSADQSIPQTLTCLSGLIEEFFLSSAEPSLRRYRLNVETGESVPEFADSQGDEESVKHATVLRKTVDHLSEEWKSELSDPLFVDDLASASLSELMRFLRHPTCEEAAVVSLLHHSSEATNSRERAEALARAMTISDGLSIFARRARITNRSKKKEPLWIAGSRILTPAWIRAFNQLMIQPIPFRR